MIQNSKYCYATIGALFRDGHLGAALQIPRINHRHCYGCSNNLASAWHDVNSPAEQSQSYSSSTAEQATNLTALTTSTQVDVDAHQQETAFNDAAAVTNDESTSSTTQLERFNELQSIIAFLERPTVIWQSRIDSTATPLIPVGTAENPRTLQQKPLKTFTFPSDLMKVGQKFDKIRNFEWFKSDVKLRILINANPFVAGRLFVTYSPMDTNIYPFAQIDRKGRVGVTSYPGVEIDLQTNTAAELLVPWINEADAQKASIEEQNLFRVDIWALTPLLVADNSLKIPITVFASFANISLKFPTPIAYQLPTGVSQMAVKKREAKGPIEEVASGISNIAGRLTDLPVVGTIASSAKWASDLVGGVASVFGWSRPIEGSGSTAFVHIPGRGMGQFKSTDTATVLGMSNDNEIAEETNNFVSNVDEMSIDHICSRPGLIDVIDWSTTADFNTQLGACNCNRETVYNVNSGNNNQAYTVSGKKYRSIDSTLAEYVLDNFHMYRADWHFRISLVKTAFHVGRLEFVFIPNRPPDDLPPSTDTTNAYRQIFDITEQNEFEFVVPFNHKNIMFRRDPSNFAQAPTVGTLYIRVNSPLTCPETVSQSIKILIWKYATNVATAYPILNGNVPSADQSSSYIPSGVSQINVTNENKNVKYIVFGDENKMGDNLTATKVVGGENCINLREATRSFRRAFHIIGDGLKDSYNIPNILTYRYNGYLGLCSNIFYFYRGGLSYKIVNFKPQSLYSFLSSYPDQRISPNVDSFENCCFHFTPESNPVHEVSVPFYSETRRKVCNDTRGVDVAGIFDRSTPFVSLTRPDGGQMEKFDVFAAGKDDLTFGFLIGVPLMDLRYYQP